MAGPSKSRSFSHGRRFWLLTGCAAAVLSAATAAARADEVEQVVVTATQPSKSDVGSTPEALPASTTVVTADEIARRPVSHYTDLFKPVAGMSISKFQPGGLAVGISLRGYSGGNHGRDIARVVDGMPLAALGNIGASDMNWIMPETIERIEVIRGPFSAEYGEDALGGAVNIVTKDQDRGPSLGYQAGSYATQRGFASFAAAPSAQTGITPLVAAEVYNTEGYQDNSDYRRYNMMAKVSKSLEDGTLSGRVQASQGEWGAPNYFPIAAYRNGTVGERDAVSATDGGESGVQMAVVNWRPHDADNGWSVSSYAFHNEFTRYSTSYATKQQTATHDKRTTLGGTVKHTWTGDMGGMPAQWLVGTDLRADSGATSTANVVNHAQGRFTANVDYQRQLLAGFAQGQVKPLSWLKLTLGGRYDRAFFDIDNVLVPAAGTRQDVEVFSPKAGITVTPVAGMDLFANYGEGFRMPNIASEMRTNPVVGAQKVQSEEVGVQFQLPLNSTLRGAVWHTWQENELRSVNSVVQNLGDSQRDGFDLEGRTFLVKDADSLLSLYASYSRIRAKLVDRYPETKVTDVPNYVAALGIEAEEKLDNGDTVGGSLNVQFYGRKWSATNGSDQTHSYQVADGKLTYGIGSNISTFAQGTWVLGDRYSELASTTITVVPEFTGLIGVTYRFQ